jgi:hypothetical protein
MAIQKSSLAFVEFGIGLIVIKLKIVHFVLLFVFLYFHYLLNGFLVFLRGCIMDLQRCTLVFFKFIEIGLDL